jgi:hypothetical protein
MSTANLRQIRVMWFELMWQRLRNADFDDADRIRKHLLDLVFIVTHTTERQIIFDDQKQFKNRARSMQSVYVHR